MQVRFVRFEGITYLRAEDVAAYLREVAGAEETDVRNRLNEAARNLTQRAPKEAPSPLACMEKEASSEIKALEDARITGCPSGRLTRP